MTQALSLRLVPTSSWLNLVERIFRGITLYLREGS